MDLLLEHIDEEVSVWHTTCHFLCVTVSGVSVIKHHICHYFHYTTVVIIVIATLYIYTWQNKMQQYHGDIYLLLLSATIFLLYISHELIEQSYKPLSKPF